VTINGEMLVVTRQCTVQNPKGIHCRVATRLAEIVADHEATVHITDREGLIDCASILDVLSMALVHGSRVSFTAHGPEAHKVLSAVENLLSHVNDP
jgi:phosphotransferase system HPr (HPr) family protein